MHSWEEYHGQLVVITVGILIVQDVNTAGKMFYGQLVCYNSLIISQRSTLQHYSPVWEVAHHFAAIAAIAACYAAILVPYIDVAVHGQRSVATRVQWYYLDLQKAGPYKVVSLVQLVRSEL